MERHEEIQDLEYNHITDGIFIGTNKCCQTHFEEKLSTEEGIEVDISLEAERIDSAFGAKFYVWLPVVNFEAPTQDQLNFGVDAILKFLSMGKKVYVHCMNGHGRAPTLVAAYLIKSKGLNAEEAIAFIKKHRSAIHLEEVQVESLKEFKKSLS